MKYKKTIIITILLMILLIPFKVEAGDYKIMLSYFSNGGTVSSGNVEIISGVVFIKNSTKVDITYSSNQTINHINSLDGTNTFTLKKGNATQTKTKEWYAINYINGKKIYFDNSKTYTVKDIIKKLNIDTSYNENSGNAVEIYMQANYEKSVSIEKITLNPSSIKIKKGKTATLKTTISPSNATDKSITWSSEDKTIAKVDQKGNVTALKEGTTNIVATTNDGKKIAKCKITVQDSTSGHNVIIKYNLNGGSLSPIHGKDISTKNSYIYCNNKIECTKASYSNIINGNNGLPNYDNTGYINVVKNGYIAKKEAEWNTKPDGTGKSYSQRNTIYKANDFCNASKKDCTITLYVNWEKKKYVKEKVNTELKITAIDYKNPNCGDAVLLKSRGRYMLMYGTNADTDEINSYLEKNKIKNLDLYISHYHFDHWYGIYKVMLNASKYDIKTLYLPKPSSEKKSLYDKLVVKAQKSKIKVITLTTGSTFQFGDATGKVLYHKINTADENDRSLVTIIQCGTVKYFTAGDITAEIENELIKNNLDIRADIMKLSHHAVSNSKMNSYSNSMEMLKKVNPKYIFYQYNHTGLESYADGYTRYGDSEQYFALKNIVTDDKNKIKYYNLAYQNVENIKSLNRAVYSTRYNGTTTFEIRNNQIDTITTSRNKKRIIIEYMDKYNKTKMFEKIFDVNNKSNYTIYDYKKDIKIYKYESGYNKIKESGSAANLKENTIKYQIYYQ